MSSQQSFRAGHFVALDEFCSSGVKTKFFRLGHRCSRGSSQQTRADLDPDPLLATPSPHLRLASVVGPRSVFMIYGQDASAGASNRAENKARRNDWVLAHDPTDGNSRVYGKDEVRIKVRSGLLRRTAFAPPLKPEGLGQRTNAAALEPLRTVHIIS